MATVISKLFNVTQVCSIAGMLREITQINFKTSHLEQLKIARIHSKTTLPSGSLSLFICT